MSRTHSTSRSLLIRVQQRDAEAWDRLVSLYAPLLMYWLRRWRVAEDDVPDVFQEVFRAAAMSIDRFRRDREGDSFRGWLRTIARNKANDYFLRLNRQPRAAGGSEALGRLALVPDESPQPTHPDDEDDEPGENDAEQQLFRRALEQIRSRFKEHTWRAFWRTAVDGQSATDVADELGMKPGAVRVAKARVLQRLREELGDLIE